MADRLQAQEAQRKIYEAINKSVKDEEKKIIEDAHKRMAAVHARKDNEA